MTNQAPALDSVLDLNEAMANMDGDAELLQEVCGIFLATAEAQFDGIDQGIAAGNTDEVAIQAHGLKGAASNFCAHKFVAASQQLEVLAKSGTLEGATNLLAQMRADYMEVVEVIKVVNWQELSRRR
jgi:HPt (histidine-containing phosphotransfer) domain-containing protein